MACERPCSWCGSALVGLSHAGFENVSDGNVLEIPGPSAGWESEFSATVSELLVSGFAADLKNLESKSPVVHVGIGHASSFQQTLFQADSMFGKACSAGEIEGNNVVWGSVLDGTIATSSDLNGLSGDSSSCCSEPDDCSSCNVASTVGDGSEKEWELQ